MKTFTKAARALCLAGVAGLFGVLGSLDAASAQMREPVKRVQDWSVFKQGEAAQRECWIVTQPVSSTARRGGAAVDVRRGDIFLMVGIRPGERVKNEVYMMAGYPFRQGEAVKVKIGDRNYEMFTKGEGAWTDSAESDDKLVTAMKRGADAQVRGVSSRGTVTTDTFSLRGFTAALSEARRICN